MYFFLPLMSDNLGIINYFSLVYTFVKGDNLFSLTYSSTKLFKDIIKQVIKMPDETNFRNIVRGTMQDTLANHLT